MPAEDRVAFIADPRVLEQLHLTVDDLADPDIRSVVIRHEHPDFEVALDDSLDDSGVEVEVAGQLINPRLHYAMHEIVATQLWENDPREVWETAHRLLEAGYERHEILHMLAGPMSTQVWNALHEKQPYDRESHLAALGALPESWERERRTISAERRHNDGQRNARRAARAARRRNRRR